MDETVQPCPLIRVMKDYIAYSGSVERPILSQDPVRAKMLYDAAEARCTGVDDFPSEDIGVDDGDPMLGEEG